MVASIHSIGLCSFDPHPQQHGQEEPDRIKVASVPVSVSKEVTYPREFSLFLLTSYNLPNHEHKLFTEAAREVLGLLTSSGYKIEW